MKILAPAKINLHLRVAPVAANGFHPLLSWMCTIGLFDKLTFDRQVDGPSRFTCDDPSLPTDERNLVVRAAAEFSGVSVDIHLAKRVPSGGGLGGGSSDAAFTLKALNTMCERPFDDRKMIEVAAKLGSDVPFFLHAPSAVCRGRGEIVRPIAPPRPKWCLLILPGLHVSTPAVYRKFDELNCGDESTLDVENEPDWQAWTLMSATELLPQLKNDLETPAFAIEPKLPTLRGAAEEIIGRPVRMSGSGSSLFTLFDDSEREQAEQSADRIRSALSMRVESVAIAPPTSANG